MLKMSMRKRALAHPSIVISPCNSICYNLWTNEVELSGKMSDEHCVNALVHEVDHWAQAMFLSKNESDKVYVAYNEARSNHRVPFIEKINIRPSASWLKSMEEERLRSV